MRLIVFCFTLFFCFSTHHVLTAGNEGINLEELQKKYSDEHAVYLSEKEHVVIKTKGNEFEIYSDVNWEILYLSDKGRSYGDQNIQFSMEHLAILNTAVIHLKLEISYCDPKHVSCDYA